MCGIFRGQYWGWRITGIMGILLHNTSLDIMLKEESSKLNAQTQTPTTEIPKWETDHLGLCRYILQDLGISDFVFDSTKTIYLVWCRRHSAHRNCTNILSSNITDSSKLNMRIALDILNRYIFIENQKNTRKQEKRAKTKENPLKHQRNSKNEYNKTITFILNFSRN